MIFSKPVFQLWPEVPDKTLYWPSSAVSQSADGVALNLFAQFPNHINLLWLRVALSEPPHHCIHPVDTLSAGGALTTWLVLVEHCKPCNCLNHICLLVHDNHCRCPETCLLCHQVVKVHQNFVTNRLGDEGSGAASRDDTEQVVPAADHSAAVALDQLLQGDAHLLLHRAGVVHVARDVEQLGAGVPGAAHAGEPVSPLLQMVGATATVSTLVTVVGQPKTPTSAGNGGFRRGLPCLPSRLSIKAVSSPQM